MARTVSEIYNAMIEAKETQIALQQVAPNNDTAQELQTALNSSSKVALWRTLFFTVAMAIHIFEVILDLFKAEITTIAANGVSGTARWYAEQSKLYQYGDTLEWNATKLRYEYAVIDDDLKIIKHCAIVEQSEGLLVIKVAKGTTTLTALNSGELAGFTEYMKQIRFAGTWIQAISGEGDILRCAIYIYYSPLVDFDELKQNVINSINNYVKNLPFNGVFRISNLVDAIQQQNGVIDVDVDTIQTKPLPTGNYDAISVTHVPNFGYYRIDDTSGNTLNDTLIFLPS